MGGGGGVVGCMTGKTGAESCLCNGCRFCQSSYLEKVEDPERIWPCQVTEVLGCAFLWIREATIVILWTREATVVLI